MKVKFSIAILVSISVFFAFAQWRSNLGDEYVVYQGIATDLKSDKLYYVEEHKELLSQHQLVETIIQYKDAAGEIIAKKVIDYSENKITPSFEQQDYRDGYVEGITYQGDKLVFKYRKSSSDKLKTKTISKPADLVVDGGFNYYIKAHWDELLVGQSMVFNFAVPSQLDYFSFRLYKESNQSDAVVFRMEPDNFILRNLVDPIRVTYKKSTKRILKYEGLSNINDRGGKSYLVKIMYPKVGP